MVTLAPWCNQGTAVRFSPRPATMRCLPRRQCWARVITRIYPGLGHSVDGRELRDVAEFLKTALQEP